VIALITVGYQYWTSPPNLYAILGVSSSVSSMDLRRHYLQMVRHFHPDNNPGGATEELFIQIRESYELLSQESVRDNYNRFGLGALRSAAKSDEPHVILVQYAIGAAMFYSLWGFITLVMMRGKPEQAGRGWALTALLALVLLDVQLTFGDMKLLPWLLPSATNYDRVQLLRALYASVFSGCRVLSQALYEDEDEADRALLAQVHENTKSTLAILAHLNHELVAKPRPGADGSCAPSMPADAEVLARLERAKELLGPAREATFQAQNKQQRMRQRQQQQQQGGGLTGLIGYLAVPLAINFLLNR
jgi:hypothetical protein